MNVFKRAILKWGKSEQLHQLQEECGELIAAINQYRRNRLAEQFLCEEIADVKIMVQQMWEVLDQDLLNDAYARKIARLDGMLKEVGA